MNYEGPNELSTLSLSHSIGVNTTMKEQTLMTREGFNLIIKGHDSRLRFEIHDNWSGERLRFELSDIAASILCKFIQDTIHQSPK